MPASYPTSVKTFTTKNAGDIITPAFVNDLQDEVHALSSGLLSGTARFQSSASTMAALSAGGSTMASLQVSSNCTIAGTLTVNKIVSTSVSARSLTTYVWAYTDNAPLGSSRVNLPAASSNSTLSMALNQEFADLLSEYDSTTYIFTPKSSGFYRIEAGYEAAAPNLGYNAVEIRVNDTVYAAVRENIQSGNYSPQVTCIARLSSGATGRVRASIWSGTSSVLSSQTYKNWFRVTRIW